MKQKKSIKPLKLLFTYMFPIFGLNFGKKSQWVGGIVSAVPMWNLIRESLSRKPFGTEAYPWKLMYMPGSKHGALRIRMGPGHQQDGEYWEPHKIIPAKPQPEIRRFWVFFLFFNVF